MVSLGLKYGMHSYHPTTSSWHWMSSSGLMNELQRLIQRFLSHKQVDQLPLLKSVSLIRYMWRILAVFWQCRISLWNFVTFMATYNVNLEQPVPHSWCNLVKTCNKTKQMVFPNIVQKPHCLKIQINYYSINSALFLQKGLKETDVKHEWSLQEQ